MKENELVEAVKNVNLSKTDMKVKKSPTYE
jgi:hypothetical protein